MRKLNEIIVHCTGTIPSESTTVEAVRKYHVEHIGWKDIGYHYLIYLDGSIHAGRPIDQKGAHCKNHNEGTVGICYVGGLVAKNKAGDTRTPMQKTALRNLIRALKVCFPTIKKVSGHRDYDNKACPCFNANDEYGGLVKD
jgi:N-acetyl-anhydromuramyl-L-alanine amidase AmpD